MELHFTKMEGIGNDYVYVDGINQEVPMDAEFISRISNRHFGIGGDGMIVILKSDRYDFKMRMFNLDGSEGMMCGKPILMSRMSDYKTLVSEYNGFLCDANNPATIAEALQKFADLTPQQRNKMGNVSKEMAQKLFDPEKNIDQWEKIIKSLVSKKRKTIIV